MPESVEIGMGRLARRAYDLADVAIVPSRRTRSSADVSTTWQIDAYRFDIPLLADSADAIASPDMVAAINAAGGLGVFNAEGLWSRYDDPSTVFDDIVHTATTASDPDEVIAAVQRAYSAPIQPELLERSLVSIKGAGGTLAVRVSPQNAAELAPQVIGAGAELLVIHGTIVSAEHVQRGGEALNLKSFIADLDVPVIVGGATNYQTAIHLMRTGAAGVIVGTNAGAASTTGEVLGITVPMATAIADAAAARREYLDETGGRYVHVIAAGDVATSADIAKAVACGADAVCLGEPLAACDTAPGRGWYWPHQAAHPVLPRGIAVPTGLADTPLDKLLHGPATDAEGRSNLFGALRRAMAKSGYSDVKEFQKVGLIILP